MGGKSHTDEQKGTEQSNSTVYHWPTDQPVAIYGAKRH